MAEELLQKVLDQHGACERTVEAMTTLAYIRHHHHMNAEQAAHLYRQAVSIGGPSSSRAMNNLGFILYTGGGVSALSKSPNGTIPKDVSAAEELLKQAIQVNPSYIHPYHNLAGLLEDEQDNFSDSEDLLRKAIEIEPLEPGGIHQLACLMRVKGKTDDAIELWIRALDVDPSYSVSRVSLAICLEKDDPEGAVWHYLRCLEIDPTYDWAARYYGRLLWKKQDWIAAEQYLRLAASLSSDKKEDLTEIGMLLGEMPRQKGSPCLFELCSRVIITCDLPVATHPWIPQHVKQAVMMFAGGGGPWRRGG